MFSCGSIEDFVPVGRRITYSSMLGMRESRIPLNHVRKKAKGNSLMINCRQSEFPRQQKKWIREEIEWSKKEPWNTGARRRRRREGKKSKRIDKSINHIGFLVLRSSFQQNVFTVSELACGNFAVALAFLQPTDEIILSVVEWKIPFELQLFMDIRHGKTLLCEGGKQASEGDSFTTEAYYHVTLSLGP